MGIVPIIIYRDRRTTQELRSEAEFDRRIRQRMEEDEAMKRYREEKARRDKLEAKRKQEMAVLKELDEAEIMNPWEFRILPGGWNLFGQLSTEPIPWDGTEEEYKNLTEDKK